MFPASHVLAHNARVVTTSLTRVFIQALRDGDAAAFDALAIHLADGVDFVSAVSGPTAGPDAVIALLQRFQADGRFSRATSWSGAGAPPALQVIAEFPLDSFYACYAWDLALDTTGCVARISQTGVAQTAPLPASPIVLNDDIVQPLRIARETRNPVIVAYVDAGGRPSQAPRGTVQVFDEQRLALWLHNRHGGLASAIAANDNISLHYWGGIGTAYGGTLLFQGRAHFDETDDIRRRVYDGSPASEQRSDPEMRGCALIVELESVTGFMAGRRYNMQRTLTNIP